MVNNTPTELTAILEAYKNHLNILAQKKDKAAVKEIAAVLQSRDEIESAIKNNSINVTDQIDELVQLDERCKALKSKYIKDKDLEKCKQALCPDTENWWWQPAQSNHPILWTLAIALCTVGIFSYTGAIIRVLPVFGFSLGSIIGTISSGAIGLFVGKSGLTEDGKRRIKSSLSAWGVDSKNHDRAIFTIALLLFGMVAAYSHWLLPFQARQKVNEADRAFQNGNSLASEEIYREALKFPSLENDSHINFRLGQIHENRGAWQEAITYYEAGVSSQDIDSYTALIRVKILIALDDKGWGKLSSSDVREIKVLLNEAEELIKEQEKASNPELFGEAQQQARNNNVYSSILSEKSDAFRELLLNRGILDWATIDPSQTFSESGILNRQIGEAKNAFGQMLAPYPLNLGVIDSGTYEPEPESGTGSSAALAVLASNIMQLEEERATLPGCFYAMVKLMELDMQGIPSQSTPEIPEGTQSAAIKTYQLCYLNDDTNLGRYRIFLDLARETAPLANSINPYVEYVATINF